MTANYDFLEPKAVALTQDIYMAPNIVTAEWHERQLHFAAVLYAREQWATQTTLCAATRQLTIELTERGSWDTQTREVAIRAGKRSTFLGLHKDPGCCNPQWPDIAVLNWHSHVLRVVPRPSFLPHSLLCLYSRCCEDRGISSNKGNQARLRKKIQRSPSL